MMEHIPELSRRDLRKFGLVTGGMFIALFGLLVPWLARLRYPLWPWVIAGVLGVWALVAPQTLQQVYRRWMQLGQLMGRVTTPLILGIVFFLLITPTGWVMRAFGRDPMSRKFDPAAETYRVRRTKGPKEDMERPF